MTRIGTPTQAEERSTWLFGLDRLRLRFRDQALESAFRADRFRLNLGMTELVGNVVIGGQSVAIVAGAFLTANGLL